MLASDSQAAARVQYRYRQGHSSEQQNIQGLYPGVSLSHLAHLFGESQRLKVVTPSLELLLCSFLKYLDNNI